MQNVELIRLRGLLPDGEDLEPAKALDLVDYFGEVAPLGSRER